MANIPEHFVHDIAESIHLPALSPGIAKTVTPALEAQVVKILQSAVKFQRRGKRKKLTVDDINSALGVYGLEHVYGYPSTHQITNLLQSSETVIVEDAKISLEDYIKTPIPRCPLLPDLSLHWLAIEGTQPNVPENPSVIIEDDLAKPITLPKELQYFYARVTGILLAEDIEPLVATFTSLQRDRGLDSLVPYFCQFIYSQVKANIRKLPLLRNLVRAIRAMLENTSLQLDTHLHQLIPALMTCVVGVRLSSTPTEDHWSLRKTSALIVASLCKKFSTAFPDLLPRACKTYIEALGQDRPFVTVYGGLIGLMSLGHNVVKTLLMPNILSLSQRFKINKKHQHKTAHSNSIESRVPSTTTIKSASGVTSRIIHSEKDSHTSKKMKIDDRNMDSSSILNRKAAPTPSATATTVSSASTVNIGNHIGNSSSQNDVIGSRKRPWIDKEVSNTISLTSTSNGTVASQHKSMNTNSIENSKNNPQMHPNIGFPHHAPQGREEADGDYYSYLVQDFDKLQCSLLLQQVLGDYMKVSMRTYISDLDLGDGLLPRSSIQEQRNRSRQIRSAATKLIGDMDISEKLVPYYVSSSKEINHVRMFI